MNNTYKCILQDTSETSVHILTIICGVIFGVVDVFIVISNIFIICCLSISSKSRSRKYLINLAISDLCLGMFVMPMYILDLFPPLPWFDQYQLSDKWIFVDLFFSNITVFNLVIVAYDRFLAVCYALRYNQMISRYRTTVCVVLPWLIGTMVSIPIILVQPWLFNLGNIRYTEIPNSHLPIAYRSFQLLIPGFVASSLCIYYYFRVCLTVIHDIRDKSSGFVKHEPDSKKKTNLWGSARQKGDTIKPRTSFMRVHVGGQPHYMKVTQPKKRKHQSKMFAHLPETAKCGFLIVSATIPKQSQDGNKKDGMKQSQSGARKTSSKCDKDSEQTFRIKSVQNLEDTSFLKPPKTILGRLTSRKSDSEFTSIRDHRRCALMPLSPRLHQSVSNEACCIPAGSAQTTIITKSGSGNLKPPSESDSSLYVSKQCIPDSKHMKIMKTIIQFLINCLPLAAGWFPFFLLLFLEFWLSYVRSFSCTFNIFFWGRFFLTAMNTLVIGYATEDIRKAFRYVIYCGHPRQEKEALKRLVLAGLGAAGVPYGRPITISHR